jgi:hypothetical protein
MATDGTLLILLANPNSYFSPQTSIYIMEHEFIRFGVTIETILEFPPLAKAVRGRFFAKGHGANGANAGCHWNSPLKKGDKGGCFLCCLNPVIMSFQPEYIQKPTPHSFS